MVMIGLRKEFSIIDIQFIGVFGSDVTENFLLLIQVLYIDSDFYK